jgi:hypothetical protein
MLHLKLVEGMDLTETSLLHRTKVLKHVVLPWFGSNRTVSADSYFALVGAAKELYRNGLRFIGVVKTATKGFPKKYLINVELHQRGIFLGLASDPTSKEEPTLAALFGWIARVGLSLQQHDILQKEHRSPAASGGSKSTNSRLHLQRKSLCPSNNLKLQKHMIQPPLTELSFVSSLLFGATRVDIGIVSTWRFSWKMLWIV